MTRTPEEVFAHHAQALGAGDLDKSVDGTILVRGDSAYGTRAVVNACRRAGAGVLPGV